MAVATGVLRYTDNSRERLIFFFKYGHYGISPNPQSKIFHLRSSTKEANQKGENQTH